MLALESHRSPHVTAVILAIGALALRTAFSQPEPAAAPNDPVRATVARVQEIQSLEGIDSPALIEPLTALAVLYDEQGDDDLAVAAIERASRIVRGTYGLYSLKEAPLLRQLLVRERAAGNAEAAWRREQDLLRLVDKNPGSFETVPILRDVGDSRLDLLRRYVSGAIPPEIILGCYYERGPGIGPRDPESGSSCSAGSRNPVTYALLRETQFYYQRAAETLVQHQGYRNTEVPELWMKCVRIAYEFRDKPPRWDFARERNRGNGRSCLRHLATYAETNSHPLPAQMDALVQLADWELLFARARNTKAWALQNYERTYALIEQRGLDRAAIAQLFSADVPVVLPTFLPSPLTAEEPAQPTGHVDVAFDITQYGAGERVEILAATPEITEAEQERLVKLIESSRFRPRTADGRFEASSRVVVRYFVDRDGG